MKIIFLVVFCVVAVVISETTETTQRLVCYLDVQAVNRTGKHIADDVVFLTFLFLSYFKFKVMALLTWTISTLIYALISFMHSLPTSP